MLRLVQGFLATTFWFDLLSLRSTLYVSLSLSLRLALFDERQNSQGFEFASQAGSAQF